MSTSVQTCGRLVTRWLVPGLLTVLLAACGGGGGSGSTPSSSAEGAATISAVGGTVDGPDGSQVAIPPNAMTTAATVRIAKDASGMPALPDHVTVVGSVWQVTPHGTRFAEPVLVSLPPPARALAANEELRVAKVSPGGQWELLAPEVTGQAIRVNVQSFSYFVPVVVSYQSSVQSLPALTLQTSYARCRDGSYGSCTNISADNTLMEIGLSSNQGALPQGCNNPQLRIGTSGDILVGDTTPSSWTPDRALNSYNFNFTVATTLQTDFGGSRPGVIGEVSVQLVCNAGSASESRMPMVSVPVRFPAINVPPSFSMSVDSLTCNGGPCNDLAGPQDVRLWVKIAPGSVLPEGCTAPLTLAVRESYNQTPLASTGQVPTSGSVALGGSFVFSNLGLNTVGYFRVVRPTSSNSRWLYFGGVCANGQTISGGHVMLNFVNPQQAVAPAFTAQPASMAVREGQTADFNAVLTGYPTPTLQWYTRSASADDWTTVPGATSTTFITAPTTLADNGRQYKLVATNTMGSVDSVVVTLSVNVNDLAPNIATQPASLNVVTGSDAVFAVVATGTGGLSYQWLHDGSAITGANGSILKLSTVGQAQAGSYTVQISNAAGSVTSQTAQLVVSNAASPVTAPSIVTQPVAVTVNAGNVATFAAGVGGTGPFTYQWLKDGSAITGATSAFHSIASVAAGDAGSYSVRVTNSAGTATSSGALLTVVANPVVSPVTITTQPSPQIQLPGGSAVFAVAATGTGPFTYQWLKNGAAIGGATDAVLQIAGVQAADAAAYSVTVGNSQGSVTSNPASLTVVGAPAISTQPASTSAVEGTSATFSVGATGSNLRYQWTLNNVAIAGATGASYTTGALALADSGGVVGVVVYNGAGIVFSAGATLTVSAAPAATGPLVLTANSGGNTLSVFRADSSTGALTGLGTTSTGSYPYKVAISPNGKFAFASNLMSGSIQPFTIDQAAGTVTAGSGRGTSSPYGVAVDPQNRFVWVANYDAAGTVSTFLIDASTGALTPSGSPVSTNGNYAYAVAAHPSGHFIYVVNETGSSLGSISAFTVDSTTGIPTRVETITGLSSPHDVKVSADGRFLFVAQAGFSRVTSYSINTSTGALTAAGDVGVNYVSSVRALTVHPGGLYLFVATNAGVNILSVDATTGALANYGSGPFATGTGGAMDLALNSAGNRLYAVNYTAATVSTFTLANPYDVLGLGLTEVGSPIATGSQPFGIAVSP